MPDSIIDGIRRYIAGCPLMSEFDGKHRHIDWTEADNDNYGIFPDTDDTVTQYIGGSQERRYACSVIIRRLSKQDADRLNNSEFLERLQRWFEERTEEDELPDLPEGCEALDITAANAMMSEMSATGKYGTYSMQIILKYFRE